MGGSFKTTPLKVYGLLSRIYNHHLKNSRIFYNSSLFIYKSRGQAVALDLKKNLGYPGNRRVRERRCWGFFTTYPYYSFNLICSQEEVRSLNMLLNLAGKILPSSGTGTVLRLTLRGFFNLFFKSFFLLFLISCKHIFMIKLKCFSYHYLKKSGQNKVSLLQKHFFFL